MVGQCGADRLEVAGRDTDLQIVVWARGPADEQLDRPAARHVPARVHAGQALGDLVGLPGVPHRRGQLDAAWSQVVL